MAEKLFESLEFKVNAQYEAIIEDLISKKYSIVDAFFSTDEVDTLRDTVLLLYEEDLFKKSAIGNYVNEEIDKTIRGDFILWINESKQTAAEAVFFNKINALLAYWNKTCFLGILQKEFHYAVYPKGTFYKRHLDTFQNDDRRKLSIVCYLNDTDWNAENGGELTLYLAGEDKNILPLPGRIVIFESQLIEHEVKIVTASQRLSITGWLKTR